MERSWKLGGWVGQDHGIAWAAWLLYRATAVDVWGTAGMWEGARAKQGGLALVLSGSAESRPGIVARC
eukprot:12917890-Prorocentrum_lima.AAC.1